MKLKRIGIYCLVFFLFFVSSIPVVNGGMKRRKNVRFVVFNALQFRTTKGEEKTKLDSLSGLDHFVSEMNNAEIDFVIELGDFYNQNYTKSKAQLTQGIRELDEEYHIIKPSCYHVVGKGDVQNISTDTFLKSIVNEDYVDAFPYYSFTKKGIHFIVLDTNEEVSKEHDQRKKSKKVMKDQDGREVDTKFLKHFFSEDFDVDASLEIKKEVIESKNGISRKQLEWLKSDLERYAKPTIVFMDFSKQGKEGSVKKKMANEFLLMETIHQSGQVLAVISGGTSQGYQIRMNDIQFCSFPHTVSNDSCVAPNYATIEVDLYSGLKVDGTGIVKDQLLEF